MRRFHTHRSRVTKFFVEANIVSEVSVKPLIGNAIAPVTNAHTASDMDHDVLVHADRISKKFCKSLRKSLWYGIKDIAYEFNPLSRYQWSERYHHSVGTESHDVCRPLREGEFWAIKNASISVRRGECLGLIGKNGAGKTTLLKILTGLIKPESGVAILKGRVGALISLGAGFNPVLTGRENIYVNSSILGLSKAETDRKIEDIISFAELREFIDSPVMNYSSGMQLRLGFAIATSFVPDILILDEVFAVGDVAFGFKCWKRISEIKKSCAVVLVSHSNTNLSRLCTHGAIIDGGVLGDKLPIEDALSVYRQATDVEATISNTGHRMQSDDIEDFSFSEKIYRVRRGNALQMRLSVTAKVPLEIGRIEFALTGVSEIPCCRSVIADASIDLLNANVATEVIINLPDIQLSVGRYSLLLGIFDRKAKGMHFYSRFEIEVVVDSDGQQKFTADGELCYSPNLELVVSK